jgi:CheY-like chemotaxis protein
MARILIAEDDADLALGLKNNLEIEGYEVRIARDGATALQLYRDFKPDLLLLDVVMPHVDGLRVLRELRTAWRTRNLRPIPSRRLRSATASRTKVISPAPSKPSTATHQRRRANSPGRANLRLSIDRSDPRVPSNA